MKKFLVFVCVLCLTLGLGVPALAVDDGGEITLQKRKLYIMLSSTPLIIHKKPKPFLPLLN